MKREPLITAATASAVVAALITLIVAFGADISEDQTKAILGFVGVIAPLAVAAVARGKVTPLSDPKDAYGMPLHGPIDGDHKAGPLD